MKSELLIPVGSMEILYAAVNNGADAVYLGGKRFGARAFSNNFDNEEMIKAIKYCHLYGVKIYVTVNTMIYNDEVDSLLEYIDFLYKNHVDALIMQDIGMINLVRSIYPNLDIHVSTQAHNINEYGIKYYHDIGCKRVVLARELSLDYINSINIPIEKEVFVYGALCVCYSGNCLFSSLNGGRSGNRGECTQCCRLPYKLFTDNNCVKEGYLLSTKDLNTMDYLKELLDSNITSLKVEGRMKSIEYVSLVTKIYRRLIDNYYNNQPMIISEEEKINLLKVFNRGFTKGYLFNEENISNTNTSNHQGINLGKVLHVNDKKIFIKLDHDLHQEDGIRFLESNKGMYVNMLYNQGDLLVNSIPKNNIAVLDNKIGLTTNDTILLTSDYLLNKELNNLPTKKINISIIFDAILNDNMKLYISDGINNVEVHGNVVNEAINAPIDKDRINTQLNKLGDTPFICNDCIVNADNNIFISIKELNELRRNAINELINIRENINDYYKSDNKINISPSNSNKHLISVLVRNEQQLLSAIKADIIIVTDEELYYKYKDKYNVYLRLDRVITNYKEYHNERLVVCELGSIIKYNKDNDIMNDYYFNIANDYSIKALKDLNVSSICMSIENNIDALKSISIKENNEVLVYGNVELMVIKNNILNIDKESLLVDQKDNKFISIFDGVNTHIFHKDKINILNDLLRIRDYGTYRLEFLNESDEEVKSIINNLKKKIDII